MSWSNVALSSLVNIKGGGTPSKAKSEYWNGSIPWASVKDFKSTDLNGASDYITQEGIDNSATSLIPCGNLIVPTRMALGKVAVNSVDIAINQDLKALIIKDESVVDIEYLFRCIQSKSEEIIRQGKGATVKGITVDVLKNLQIPLPPLETQKQIAAVLEKADQLRKDCQQMEQELNSLAQSVFIDMFGDPVTNPKGWDVKPLSCLLSQPLQNGAYYPKEDYSDDGVEMVHMGDVFYDFIPRGGMKRVNASKKDIEKYKLTSNDLLISRRSLMLEGAAKPSLIEESSEDLIFESSMIRLTPSNKILNVMYLFYYLSNPIVKQHFIYQYITGATIKGINQSNLEKVEVLVPDYKMQEDFLIIEQKIRNQKNDLLNLVKEYEDNYNALMQKAFKGELDL
ncbi:restriction endonuclease subunit S [Vibrio sp. 10N.222.54.B11]|uniref:restriction endonuclease subunit S n=1 Tax=Vibrio sp. 10N.222.54.B11 TaxID=3229635 RepID=UPI00354BF124